MSKISKLFGIVATTFIMSSQSLFAGNVPESNDAIKLVMNDWTGQHVSTKIAGALLSKMGYNVDM